MPFHASSLDIVQSTRRRSMSPVSTYGRASPIACWARIFCVNVIGRRCASLDTAVLQSAHEAALRARHGAGRHIYHTMAQAGLQQACGDGEVPLPLPPLRLPPAPLLHVATFGAD